MIASPLRRQRPAREFPGRILTVAVVVRLLYLVQLSAAPAAASRASLPTLTRVTQIRSLSQDEARRGYPVRVQGVVTCYDPAWGILFVQDETGGIFVQPTAQRFELRAGEEVEVRGWSGRGDYSPAVIRPTVKVLNEVSWPAARERGLAQLFAGREDGQWVAVSGVVRMVTQQEGRVVLQITGDGRRLKVLILALPQENRTDLIGATVRLTGVCGTIADGKGSFLAPQLFVPGWANLSVEKPAPSDLFTLPITPISDLSAAGLDAEQRVRIQGTVTGFKTNQPLVLDDGTGVVQVPLPQPLALQNGIVVDAVGLVSSRRTSRVLEDAVLRRLGYGPLPPRDDSSGRPRASLSGETLALLTTTDEVRRLTPQEAERGFPVELRGVITYDDPAWGLMFFQDATAGIFVDTGGQPVDVATGDLVQLYGYSGPGDFAPVVRKPLFMIEGRAPMPTARVSMFEQLLTGKEDSQWVAISGIVRSMSNDFGHVSLKLAVGSGTLNAALPGFANRPMPNELVDARVRVRGVCGTLFDSKRRLIGVQLFVPSLAEISVEQAGTNPPWSLPVQSISSLMRFSPQGIAHRVRVQGVVTLFRPGHYLYVRDKTETIYVRTAQTVGAAVGDRVDVVGFPALGDYSRILTDATVTRIGPGEMPASIRVSADRVLKQDLDGALIQTEGYLFDTFSSLGERVFVLESGYGVFQAHLGQPTAADRFDRVSKGSLLQITGICAVDVDSARQPKAFRILLRSPEDVVVLAQPSWWTLRHVLEVGSVLVAIILLAIGWGVTLNDRVRRQTDQIRVQLRQEAALQERYRDLFENANDVIYTHDLSGRFTSLNQAGERVFGYTRLHVLAMNIHQMIAPSCAAQFQAWLREATSGATSIPGEFEMVTHAGRPVTLELSAQRICEGGQPTAVQVIARDITERKRGELYATAVSKLGRGLSVARTPKEAARVVGEVADELLGWDAFILDLYAAGEQQARTVLAMDVIDGQRTEVRPVKPAGMSPMMRRTLEEGAQMILRADATCHPEGVIRFGDTDRPAAAMMYVPIRQGIKPVGFLSIQSYQSNAYDEEKLKTLQALADHCAGALERIWVAEALRESEQRHRLLVENSNDLICELTLDGQYLYVSPNHRTLTGYAPEDLLGRSAFDQVHPEDFTGVKACFAEAAGTATFRLRLKEGGWRWLEARGRHFTMPDGERRSVVVSRDVTERKEAEEALKRTEALYRRAIAAADAVPYHRDYDTNTFTYFGEGIRELTGYGAEEMTPELWESLIQEYQIHGALHGLAFEEAAQKVRRGGVTQWQCDCRLVGRDGRTRWLADASVEILDEAGTPIGSIGTLQDITARKQDEERMRQQARLLDLAQDAILVRDLEHQVTFWNKGAERLYGWMAAETVGRRVTELIFRETDAFEFARRIFLERGEWSGELHQFTRTGKEVIVNSRWNLLRDEQGQARSVLVINTDITAQKELETQFFRTQRLESLGTLASGIAHDLNNVLAPIAMATELLRVKCLDAESWKMLDTVATSAKRGGDIVRQVLTFARGFSGERISLQLHHLIKEAAKLLRETFPKSITITVRNPTNLWLVEGDATQMHQVLLNLCLNARDAMPEGGTLAVGAENTRLDEHFTSMVPHTKPSPFVVLEVRDSGSGMNRAILDKIFDPFFTTKAAGKGTGLGLSTVLGIVKSHGGFVNVESQVGKGSTFRVYLPATPGARTPSAEDADAALPRGHGELVLVVDDEAGIRMVTERVLQKYGYTTMTAADGVEALAAFSRHRDSVRVVLTDVMMPNMGGVALVRVLRTMDPTIKIIASSGAAADGDGSPEGAELRALNVSAFLPKPYTADKLLTSLNDLLRPNGARAEPTALDQSHTG